jgi:uncharacterized protein (DUF2164 family)
MLKRIPKSDISIRPFKAYKRWAFNDSDGKLQLYEANATSSVSSSNFPKNSIYGQLRAQFYNDNVDNPFLRFGNKSTNYATGLGAERFMTGSAKVISIPQIYVGEGIKKGSVTLVDSAGTFRDDSNGNLIGAQGDVINFSIFNNNNSTDSIFTDILNTSYTVTVTNINFNTNTVVLRYLGEDYSANLVSFNVENNGEMIVDNFVFLDTAAGSDKIGNIFYNQGLVVLTKQPETRLTGSWDISFKSTKTIYEHEYLLIVNPDEFNFSQNPSAVKDVGFEYTNITGSDGRLYKVNTKSGLRFVKKIVQTDSGDILDYRYTSSRPGYSDWKGGFDDWEISSSVDTTGSFLTPYITTIGLYDDDMDLVAVAKLPQPIKSEPDFPVNFIVRFDI